MRLLCCLLSLLFCSYSPSLAQFGEQNCQDSIAQDPPQCVPSEIECRNFYSQTFYPNTITLNSASAQSGISLYHTVLNRLECSPYSEVFICLALSPRCNGSSYQSPCSSLCELVGPDCLAAIEARDQPVRDVACLLNCARYPTENCIGADDPLITSLSPQTSTTEMSTNTSNECPAISYFTDSAKTFALGWLAFWAIICFLSTALTVATFLLDTSRFPYPWRPVVYLALSFNLHSLTHFLAMAIGRELITCPEGQFVEPSINWTWGHTPCIIVFGLLYYTMMTAFMWWLMLTLGWFLASAFSWSSEAVAHLALFYHITAWVVPLLLTIILVATRVVGADELTATCFIVRDNTNMSFLALLLGVIIPLVICLITGIVFLTVGFVSILRIRSVMRSTGKATESNILEKLIIRIGIFVVVFILPACIVIGCFVYELVSRPSWTEINEDCDNCVRANPAVFMVRLFMLLLIGILTGVWIWSKKTVSSWKTFPHRVARCCHPEPAEAPSAMSTYNNGIYATSPHEMDFEPEDMDKL